MSYDNYPDDIRQYDYDPRSPFYGGIDPTCRDCSRISYVGKNNARCLLNGKFITAQDDACVEFEPAENSDENI